MLTIVSGQPRSGTTLMMRMLHQGGMDVYADTHDGYETDKVLDMEHDKEFLLDCDGKAVKILYPFILHLPSKVPCKIIWMHRDAREQAKSQRKLMNSQGYNIPRQAIHKLRKAIEKDDRGTLELFKGAENIKVMKVGYEDLKEFPGDAVMDVELFLKRDLDTVKMIDCLENRETKSQPDLSLEMGIATALDQPDTARSIRG